MDFGKHIILRLIETRRVHAFRHEGYREISGPSSPLRGQPGPREPLPVQLHDAGAPIFTHARYLPATVIKSTIERSVIADGCIINDALIGTHGRRAAGPGRRHHPGFPGDADFTPARNGCRSPCPDQGSATAWIERTIIDKNARIGDDVRISPAGKPASPTPNYYIRDGP